MALWICALGGVRQNLINFLQRQNAQFGSVVDELSVVRSGLSGTRSVSALPVKQLCRERSLTLD